MPRRSADSSSTARVPASGAVLVGLAALVGIGLAWPGAASAVDPKPNLTVSVAASPATVLVGQPWTWTATIANTGTVVATFGAGTRVFVASLPADAIVAFSGATSGRGDVSCTVDGSPDLVCTAPAGATVAAGDTFTVGVSGVASGAATLLLPRTGGSCAVDPTNVVPETSEINFCSSSMKVSVASTTTTITGHAPDPSIVGVPAAVTWAVAAVAPGGGTPAGTVTVSDGTQSCSAPVGDGGCVIAFASEGTRTLVATYGGAAGSYAGSASAAVTHAVVPPVPPNVTSLVRLDPDPTRSDAVRWALAFDRPVTGVDATDFALAADGSLAGTAVTGVAGGDADWTITASTGTGDGTLRLSVVDDDTILAAGAAPLGDVGTGNGGYAGEAYTLDRTPPETTISAGPDPVTTNAGATIAFAGEDGGTGVAGFACSLDGSPFDPCSSPLVVTVGEGPHELRVRAIDAAGNRDPSPASRAWRVDPVASPTSEPPSASVVDASCAERAVGGTLTFALEDPDGDAMTFALAADDNPGLVPPESVVVTGTRASRTVTVTPAARRGGTATLAFRLSDGTDAVTIRVTVAAGTDRDGPLAGTPGTDMLFGLGGRGTLAGGGGSDLLCGGNGDDTLDGGGGTDYLFGGNGSDSLSGGDGDDLLAGGRGDDSLAGGAGADRFSGGLGLDRLLDLAAAEGDTTDGS